MKNRSLQSYFKRYLILLIGLFIMALGVAISTKANLGTSPVSCVPYVISLFVSLTMGQVTIITHIVFILIQIMLLRKDYQIIQLSQIPVAFIFGYFTDFTMSLVQNLHVTTYLTQCLLCASSWVIIGLGVFMEVKADVIMLAGEGTMLAISKVFHIEFGKVKIGFDCTQVLIGTIISLFAFHKLTGIREGTVAAAIFVGMFVRFYSRLLSTSFDSLLSEIKTEESIRTVLKRQDFISPNED